MTGASGVAWRLFFAFAFYALLACLYYVKSFAWAASYLGQGSDPLAFVWFLHWWPFALSHGLNPFISRYVWFPHGVNIAWETSIPTAALLGLPATLLGGPFLSFNLLTLAAPALAATAACVLARELTGDWPASLLGGYLFGFSTYMFGQMLGHLNLELVFLVPVVPLLCLRRLRGQLARRHFILGLAAVLIAQLGLCAEVLATMGVIGAVCWLVVWLCAPTADRRTLVRLAGEILAAGLLMMILATPFIVYLIKGLPDVPAEVQSVSYFSADPLNFLVPTPITYFGHIAALPLARRFTGNDCEQGAYLGVPLVCIMLLCFRRQIKFPYGRALIVMTGVIFIFSLGPVLHVLGHDTKFTLPWRLCAHVPLIRAALPTRLTMYVSLCAAVAASLWLARPGSARRRTARWALALLACVALLPNRPDLPWTTWPKLAFFTPAHLRAALGPAPNVLILPFSMRGPGLAWQIESGMGFTQSGGYVGFTPKNETGWALVSDLDAGLADPNLASDVAAFCVRHGVRFVLVGPGTDPALAAGIAVLGWPQRRDGAVLVVRVPPAASLRYRYVSGDFWPAGPLAWMGRRIEIITSGTPTTLTLAGRERPTRTPVRITVRNSAGQATYTLTQTSSFSLQLPASGDTKITADQVFTPDRLIHNGDERQLSVLVTLGP